MSLRAGLPSRRPGLAITSGSGHPSSAGQVCIGSRRARPRRKIPAGHDWVGTCSKSDLDSERNIFYLKLEPDIYIEFHSRQQGIFADTLPQDFRHVGPDMIMKLTAETRASFSRTMTRP